MPTDIADILIVGSGAAGGPFAWHLSKMSGVKIVCLEQGDWVGKPGPEPNPVGAERKRLVTPPSSRADVRSFANGYPYDYSESYWQPILGNAVGGATIHYGGIWMRMRPSDFALRKLDGIADDWPISYWDLEPYYDLNDRITGVAGVRGNPAYPPRSVEFLPPRKLTRSAEIMVRGFKKLGWHWWPAERAVLTVPYGGRRACNTDCVSCDDGCPREAKNSSDVVYWPEAIRNGVVLKTRARVREILVDRKGRAEGALYYDADGRLQTQRARIVVLACNGIGTPRLLLNSRSRLFPDGLANHSGQVGRNLMGHPNAGVTGLFPNDDVTDVNLQTNGVHCEEFYETHPDRGFFRGFRLGTSGNLALPVSVALGERPSPVLTAIPTALKQGPADPIPWGRLHRVAFQERVRHTVSITVAGEELPSEANRVELHPTLTDDMGIPAPKLIYKRTDNTRTLLMYGMERAKDALRAAGATDIVSAEIGTAAPGHYMGTARMGNDPTRSVVDRWGCAHDVRNLFIIDGSVFTTSSQSAPTSTIQALALWTADYIKKNASRILGT